MKGLSKSRILAYRQCPRRLWLQIHKPEVAEDNDQTANLLSAGSQVGEIAHTLFPDGILIAGDDLARNLADTGEAIAAVPRRPVFEATFDHDKVLVRADIMVPEEDGSFRMIEVKSPTSVKDYHLVDAAIQTWVARKAGVGISRVEIAHINNSFFYPGNDDYGGLFAFRDVTSQAEQMQAAVPEWIREARATLQGEEPEIAVGRHCSAPFACQFWSYCAPPPSAEYPLDELPYVGNLAATLQASGYSDLREVPEELLPHPLHRRIRRTILSGQPEIDPEIGRQISALTFPRYYIDFETLQEAVPIWAGTRPYCQIPFQWSCHEESAPGAVSHSFFLADDGSDPRRAFAESLLTALGAEGPVLVYNAPFERTRLKELADFFPDLAPRLQAVIARMVDLLPLARAHYYHPQMRGSWSLKAVLPTIAPDLDYGELPVANGGMAQEAFREVLHPETSGERRLQLRQHLLDYCERDTLGLVRIVQFFRQ